MAHIYEYVKQCDAGVLHKLLVQNNFLVQGVAYDSGSNITQIYLLDEELKDPTDVVNVYVYVVPVIPDYPVLFLTAYKNYNTQVTNFTSAKSTYDGLGTVTTQNAVAHLNAAQQEILAVAQGVQQLYNVVKVLAQRASVTE